MYVKLVNPLTRATQVFKVPSNDVHYARKDCITDLQRESWANQVRDAGWDARGFLIWTHDVIDATEIVIPGLKPSQTVVVLTNWDAYLVHESGRTVDRIHRHLPKGEEE